MTVEKKKSYAARKNEGNDLFFRVLHNILTDKLDELYSQHIDEPTFEDVYTTVGVEKALSKCADPAVVIALADCQTEYSRIVELRHHYWYLLKKLPKTFKTVDWSQNG